jgi:hypothetical protein
VLGDRPLRLGDVGAKPVNGEEADVRVVMRVTADQVAATRDGLGRFWVGFNPASLEENVPRIPYRASVSKMA